MGERAFDEAATADDLAVMKRELADALAAGAIGFTTSRTRTTRRPTTGPWPPGSPTWSEVRELVGVMGDLGAGIFEIAGEDTGRDPDRRRDYLGRLRDLAVETGVPITWGMFSSRFAPDAWRAYFAMLDGDRARRRAHVRPGAQPRPRRGALVRDAAALRPPARVARGAPAPARRAARAPARRRGAPAAREGGRRGRLRPRRRRRGPEARLRVDDAHGRPCRRTRPSPRSRASAASIPSRP